MNANAVPAPATNNGPAKSAQDRPCTPTCVAHSVAPAINTIPAARTGAGPTRMTSHWDRPANATEVSDVASHAGPVCSAE